MLEAHIADLERIGLSTAEAQIYLTLIHYGAPMGASAIVSATGVPRSSVYPTLARLADMGIVEAEAGYGGRFSAVPATQALPPLIIRERKELSQREEIVNGLAKRLDALAQSAENSGEAEVIQILRDPRVITERFERLQVEAERQIEVCVKAPFFMGPVANTAQEKALRRGIRGRGLYEQAVLEAPEVRPYLERWIAKGEEARIYPGELPHKLAIFDRQTVLLPLFMPGKRVRTLFIRHQPLAASLGMLFDSLWEKSEPLTLKTGSPQRVRPMADKIAIARQATDTQGNGARSLSGSAKRGKPKTGRRQ